MVHAIRENEVYRRDAKLNHTLLTAAEREKLIQVRHCLDGTTANNEIANERLLAIPTNAAVKIA